MKKLFLFMILCVSFTVSAEMIAPDGVLYAAPVEQSEKAYSVILASDSGQDMAISSINTNKQFEDATLNKDRSLSYRFITSDILSIQSVLHSDLSPLKPDKRVNF